MKIKGILITLAIIGGASAGVVYGVRSTVTPKPRAVEVVAVTSVNSGGFGYYDSDSISGTIISRDTQQVELDNEHDLLKVYVQEGDQVKKGDKLLEYDMEADELKAEMEDLTRRGLELSLETLKKDLETLRSGKMPVSSDSDDSDFGFDADSGSARDDDVDAEDGDDTGSADLAWEAERALTGADDGSLIDSAEDEDQAYSPDAVVDEGGGSLIEDPARDEEDEIIPDDPGEDSYPDDVTPEDNPLYTEDIRVSLIGSVNDFLRAVNAITEVANQDDSFKPLLGQAEEIAKQLNVFRTQFADTMDNRETDLFGETITVTTYTVSEAVTAQVGESTASVLQMAYDRLCAYQFINAMNNLNPSAQASSAFDETAAQGAEAAIRASVTAFHELPTSVYGFDSSTNSYLFTTAYDALNSSDRFSGESYVTFLRRIALLLNGTQVVDPTPAIPDVASQEGLDSGAGLDGGDGGDLDDEGDGPGYTAEDIAEAIKEQEKNIKECELQIREAQLELKEYQHMLDGRIVYADMDGLVKSAGTVDHAPADGPFILITGQAGLYVRGALNELSLDTLKVGDIISGSSYETGSSFTASITEISEYPNDAGNDYYYGFGEENSNASYYPFLAYIENADGLEVDSYVELTLSGGGAGGGKLMLEDYFVRTDENGRNYCLVEGEDGLLEKRYVKVGANNWNILTIDSGLSRSDFIAFPYGDGVEEGAQTVEVDNLSAMQSDYY